MTERKDKRYVSCPVCGRHLMKCQGQCSIDITCGKCNREIVVLVNEEIVMVLENRRESGRNNKARQARISVQKKNPPEHSQMKTAANY